MVIIWGTTHAGKVDQVPGGLYHVVTQFGHLYYLPLIPTASYLVLEQSPGGGFRGAHIPLSFKSILTAWLRAGSIVAIVAAVFGFPIVRHMFPHAPWLWALPPTS